MSEPVTDETITDETIIAEPVSEDEEAVLLIHGTYAASRHDSAAQAEAAGEEAQWWQAGSDYCRRLAEGSERLRAHEPGEVFHWSGENSERARRESAERLRAHLLRFEEAGRPYHVIAHSHGGSVLWRALCGLTEGEGLSGLKSWTTIGAPFLRFRGRRRDLALGLPAFGIIAALVWLVRDRLWLFLPLKEIGFPEALFPLSWAQCDKVVAPIIWLLLAVLLMFLVFCLVRFFAAAGGVRDAWGQRRSEARALELYKGRWLCVYSRDDEAINGLQSTLRPAGDLVPRWKGKGGLAGVLTWPLRLVTNTGAYFIDRFVWERLRRQAQGNDILGLELIYVRPPADDRRCAIDELEAGIFEDVNARAAHLIGGLRRALGKIDKTGLDVKRLADGPELTLRGDELVHWSYYRYDPLVRLAFEHLRGEGHDTGPLEPDDKRGPDRGFFDAYWFLTLSTLAVAVCVASIAGFYRWELRFGILQNPDLTEIALPERDLAEAQLSRAKLTGANLRGCDLRGADLTECDLTGVDLSYARLDGAIFTKTRLNRARFEGCQGLVPGQLAEVRSLRRVAGLSPEFLAEVEALKGRPRRGPGPR